MSDLTPTGDRSGEPLLPSPPADIAPLVEVIRAADQTASDEVAAAHIVAAAQAARDVAPLAAASTTAAIVDLDAGTEPAADLADADAGPRTASRRRRAVLVALPVAVLAVSSAAAALLVGARDGGSPPPAAISTIGPGGPAKEGGRAGSGSTADPASHDGGTTGTTAEPPGGPVTPTGPDGRPTATPDTDVLGNPLGGSTTTTASGPTTVTGPPATPPPGPPPPVPTTAASAPPDASRLIVLGGTSCGPGLRLTVPGTWLEVAGTIADNCDTTIGAGASVATDTLFVRGAFAAPGTVRAGVARLQSPVPDPLMGLPGAAGGTTRAGGDVTSTVTLQPGFYTTPITITGGGTVTLAPGVYDLPGLTMTAGARLSGAGVVLFIRDGGLHIEDCASVDLSGASSGVFAGLTIVQPATNTNDIDIRRGATCAWSFRGGIYAPRARVALAGDLTFAAARLVVGSLIDLEPAHISITG